MAPVEVPFGRVASAVAAAVLTGIGVRMLIHRRRKKKRGIVIGLYRYPVKGLGREQLVKCSLGVGCCFPADRSWALMRVDKLSEFCPKEPRWVNKMSFYAACSAGTHLALLETTYFDPTAVLSVRSRATGRTLLEASLEDRGEREEAERFFTARLGDKETGSGVKIVRADADKTHQFGNTTIGEQTNGDVRTVHLVNLATVRDLARASDRDIDPFRFRANILFDGIDAWEEFKWVDQTICVGGVEMRVLKRTVRCAATCVNLDTGNNDMDVPGLLQHHFPQHGPYLGIYAQVTGAGSVQFGDGIGLRR